MRGRLVSKQTFENNSNVFNQKVRFNDLAKAVYILKIMSLRRQTDNQIKELIKHPFTLAFLLFAFFENKVIELN